MNYIVKKFLFLFLVCFLAGMLVAQPASPMHEGTNGMFGNDTDSVTSTTGWNTVDFDKFLFTGSYGYMQIDGSNTGALVLKTHMLNLAGMFKAGSLTFGLSYQGALGGNTSKGISFSNNMEDNVKSSSSSFPLFHNIRLLVGIPMSSGINLGVRAGVDFGGEIGKSSMDSPKTLADLRSYTRTDTFSYKPQLSVGTSFGLGDYTLTPTLDFSLSSVNGTSVGQSSTSGYHVGPVEAEDGSIYEASRKMRTYTPAFTLGLNVGLPSTNETISWSSKVSYGFSATVQPEKSEFTYAYDGPSKTYTESLHTYRPDKVFAHTVALNVVGTKIVSPRLTVKGKAQFDASYTDSLSGGTTKIDGTGTAEPSTRTKSVYLAPVVSLAANVKLSEMVNWYTGLVCIPVRYTMENAHSYAESGIVINGKSESKMVTHNIHYPIVSQFGTGLQVQPADELTISFGLLFGSSSEQIELTTISSVLSNANIRLGLIWKDVPRGKDGTNEWK